MSQSPVATHSGSLLRRLQLSYALATLVVVGLVAAFMDTALRHSLDEEDAVVMLAQADSLARRIATGRLLEADPERRPEKAEWRLLGPGGKVLHQSSGMDAIPTLPWPSATPSPTETEGADGTPFSILVKPLPEGTLQLAMDRSHESALVEGFRRTLAVAIGLAALLAALLGRIVARRGLRPLHLMALEAGDINPRHLDRRLHGEHFPAELGELVTTLNSTLARLEEAFDRLNRMAAELAHELRTPLQNLRAEVESIVLRPKDEETSRDALGSVLEECDRLARLIEQMLFLARSENPATAIDKKSLNIHQLLQSVADFFEAQAEESKIEIHTEAKMDLEIQGDEALLRRALHNLTANALRHTPPGGTITLGAGVEDSALSVFVRDNGEGLPAGILARLGERWVRSDSSHGLGLGLAIVKGIAQLHGGELVARNLPGAGAEVGFTLPT